MIYMTVKRKPKPFAPINFAKIHTKILNFFLISNNTKARKHFGNQKEGNNSKILNPKFELKNLKT